MWKASVASLIVFVGACGGRNGGKSVGALGGNCYPNGTCDVTLVCMGGLCVAEAGDAGTDGVLVDGAADAPAPDAQNIPSPPPLGAQIDRMGRPAINTALNHVFDVDAAAKGSAKDAYNQDAAQGSWPTTYVTEFSKNLALMDFLDSGLTCSAGTCSGSAGHNGCGNQALYNGNPNGGGAPAATSYATLATVLADDQLYLDTSKTECKFPLAVEFGFITGAGNTTCGGRAPSYDVIDYVYTTVTIGIGGFTIDGNFTPVFGDGVGPHTDIDDTTFPFLGAPHNP